MKGVAKWVGNGSYLSVFLALTLASTVLAETPEPDPERGPCRSHR